MTQHRSTLELRFIGLDGPDGEICLARLAQLLAGTRPFEPTDDRIEGASTDQIDAFMAAIRS